jgi:hypothetical protein
MKLPGVQAVPKYGGFGQAMMEKLGWSKCVLPAPREHRPPAAALGGAACPRAPDWGGARCSAASARWT